MRDVFYIQNQKTKYDEFVLYSSSMCSLFSALSHFT